MCIAYFFFDLLFSICLFCCIFVCLCLILFYCYSLNACLFSKKREKGCRFLWETKWGDSQRSCGRETDQNILYEKHFQWKKKREWMINNVEQTGKPEWWAGSFVSARDSWVCINGLEDLKYRLKGWWFSRMASESKVMFQGGLFIFIWPSPSVY